MKKEIIKQGVRSQIDFPFGQDEIAVSKAIYSLLKEGWLFRQLTLTHISLERSWEYDGENGEEEIKDANK